MERVRFPKDSKAWDQVKLCECTVLDVHPPGTLLGEDQDCILYTVGNDSYWRVTTDATLRHIHSFKLIKPRQSSAS